MVAEGQVVLTGAALVGMTVQGHLGGGVRGEIGGMGAQGVEESGPDVAAVIVEVDGALIEGARRIVQVRRRVFALAPAPIGVGRGAADGGSRRFLPLGRLVGTGAQQEGCRQCDQGGAEGLVQSHLHPGRG